jgi:hypothetical protein
MRRSGPEHYQVAERLADGLNEEGAAIVHALLAVAAAVALQPAILNSGESFADDAEIYEWQKVCLSNPQEEVKKS